MTASNGPKAPVEPPRFSAVSSGDFLKAGLGAAEEGFDALAVFGFGVAIASAHRVDEAVDPFDEEGGVFLACDRFAGDGDEDWAGVRPGRAVEDVSALRTASPQGHPAGSLHRNVCDQLLDNDAAAVFCGARFAAHGVTAHDQFQGAERASALYLRLDAHFAGCIQANGLADSLAVDSQCERRTVGHETAARFQAISQFSNVNLPSTFT